MRNAVMGLLVPAVLLGCTTVPDADGAGGQSGSTSASSLTGEATSSSSVATTSSSVTSTSTGNPSCELTEGMAVPATCGVFVKAGATGGNGSPTMPYGSVGEGLTMHAGQTLSFYLCGGDTFDEAVDLGGSSLYGGLDCATWTFSSLNPHPRLRGPSDVAAVTSISDGNRVIDSIDIESPPGVAKGASSIALLASNGSLLVARSNITAGTGAAGEPGLDGGPQAPAGGDGALGKDACGAVNPTPGGMFVSQTCGGLVMASIGGDGGLGQVSSGGDGQPGLSGGMGQKGTGEFGATGCTGGGRGSDGSPGMPGSSGVGAGVLDALGFVPAKGGDGAPGAAAQGGGGGGGSKGPADCNPGMSGAQPGPGASGGSGGAGGCGGLPGRGGSGGGSSFAIVALNVDITFSGDTSVQSADGGVGGDGGISQPGANGGLGKPGGNGFNFSKGGCHGGDGGNGGNGGGGGGGPGGHSASIVFVGMPPRMTGVSFSGPPAPASGGVGRGNGLVGGNDGTSGLSCKILDFTKAKCAL